MKTKEEIALYNLKYRIAHKERLAELKKAWINANRHKKTIYNKNWNNKNKEYYKRWYSENPDKSKTKLLKYRYGIMLDDYNRMFEMKEGKCWICERHVGELKKPLQVDHSHVTGIVRGLLCNRCNSRLRELNTGKFKCDDKLYTNAIGYIIVNNN